MAGKKSSGIENDPFAEPRSPRNLRDWSIDRNAVKALVAVYGPNEAARQAKLPRGTVLSWCRRFKWKKAATLPRSSGKNGMSGLIPKDPGDAITEAMANHKEVAEVNLAHYAANAAKQAARLKDPLDKARNVRDAAAVYRAVFPEEQGGEMVEGAILVGAAMVRDNPEEMLAETSMEDETAKGREGERVISPILPLSDSPIRSDDVRETLSDQRPEGD